jgi:nucleoside-diphosphate-sugar epimerase
MVRRLLPKRLREAQRVMRRSLRRPTSDASPAEFSRELALLHSCQVRLPTDKAERLLGFSPPISFEEGCRRSVAWLAFAGYPVR